MATSSATLTIKVDPSDSFLNSQFVSGDWDLASARLDETLTGIGTANSLGYSLAQQPFLFFPHTKADPCAVTTAACPSPADMPTSGKPTKEGISLSVPNSLESRWPAIVSIQQASSDLRVVNTMVK